MRICFELQPARTPPSFILSRTLSDDGVFFNTTKQKMCSQARLQHFNTAGGGGLFRRLSLVRDMKIA